ncbi:MAG: SDR family oxidoreductase [Deltaproteobacteria bacterium]|nr:SDR family oxidoreductase [Deltaproteobacteria bacterium]
MYDFEGQHVVVTGGTRGLGEAFTRAFLARGAFVTATYAQGQERAEKLLAELGPGDRLALARFDVSDEGAVEAFWGAVQRPVQVLINNAGIRQDAIVGMTTRESWDRVLSVNLDGSFSMAKHAVRAMSRPRYGRIIFITSPVTSLALKGTASYAASKAGQSALARTLAAEVASRNITVNCLEPGFVDTELLEGATPELREEWRKLVPLGRFGTPEEVASACLFLASKDASYITGGTLRVAGGL